jgi:hypothetical protein
MGDAVLLRAAADSYPLIRDVLAKTAPPGV